MSGKYVFRFLFSNQISETGQGSINGCRFLVRKWKQNTFALRNRSEKVIFGVERNGVLQQTL